MQGISMFDLHGLPVDPDAAKRHAKEATPVDFEEATRAIYEGTPEFLCIWNHGEKVTVALSGTQVISGHRSVWRDALRYKRMKLGPGETQQRDNHKLKKQMEAVEQSHQALEKDNSELQDRYNRQFKENMNLTHLVRLLTQECESLNVDKVVWRKRIRVLRNRAGLEEIP